MAMIARRFWHFRGRSAELWQFCIEFATMPAERRGKSRMAILVRASAQTTVSAVESSGGVSLGRAPRMPVFTENQQNLTTYIKDIVA
jgi:hypothetical protein